MGFIKRGFYSMKYRKGTNIFLMLAYTAIFALTLGILLVYLSMSSQVDHLQKSLGCAVTMRTNVNNYSTPQLSIHYCDILQEDGDAFVDSPYVESYNKVGYIQTCLMENGLEPVVRDTNLGLYEYQTGNGTGRHSAGYAGNCLVVPVTQSEPYDLFTAYGFSLTEGRHFTAEDTDAVIISTKLAERNGLKIGDQMTIASSYYAQEHWYESEDDIQHITLTICGLMDVPEAKEMGYEVTIVDSDPYNVVLASYEATKVLTNNYAPEPKLQWVIAYLKSANDLDAFIEETKQKFTIDAVLDTVSDFGYEIDWTKGGDEILQKNYERFASAPFYVLVLDNEWYTAVSKPLESVRNLMGIFLAVVLIGSAAVLALVVLLSLRGRQREFGILLAMGEPVHKVIGQIFLEIFMPLLIAAALGTLLGTQVLVPMAEDYSSSLLSTQSREEQTDLRESNKNLTKFYFGATGRYSYMPDDLRFRSSRTIAVVNSVPYKAGPEVYGAYFTLDFGMVVLILLIQMLSILRVKPARILTRRE